ncbi:VanW family protein [Ureibacillus sp. NPDC094379]
METKKWLVFACFSCALMLTGCIGNSKGEDKKTVNELEQQVEELQKEIDQLKGNVEGSETSTPEENIENVKPAIVDVIDPTTNELIQTFLPQEQGFYSNFDSYKSEVEKWARGLARGTGNQPGYDQRMVLDQIGENGQIIKGSPMVILKEKELVEKVISASKTGGEIELPLYETASGYDEKEISTLDDVVVASYTTYFDPSVTGRNKNIELSSQSIHNVIVGVEDYFSFNTQVGPRTEERGYQPATEIINGEYVMGIGGGICQTSSTLFNAVDQLGVQFVERHHHSLSVGYVPKGRDATVSYGSLDFRFQNTTGVPFLIQTIYSNDSISVQITTSKEYEEFL